MKLAMAQDMMNMDNYKLTVRVPVSYRKHIEILQRRMQYGSKDKVIKELIDRELSSLFSNSDGTAFSF